MKSSYTKESPSQKTVFMYSLSASNGQCTVLGSSANDIRVILGFHRLHAACASALRMPPYLCIIARAGNPLQMCARPHGYARDSIDHMHGLRRHEGPGDIVAATWWASTRQPIAACKPYEEAGGRE